MNEQDNGERWLNSKEDVKRYKKELLDFALGVDVFENYGYDEAEFKRMVNKRKQLLGRVKTVGIDTKHWYGIYSRLYFPKGQKALSYCTGQSWNDEMLTLLSCLSGNEALRGDVM